MEHRRAWIPAPDGARLAARLWLPERLPAAVLLEALPYRMDDLTSSYASEYERLCVEGGFAVCRLDLRGTGSSEGLAADEYPPSELEDLGAAIAWLAGQEWSTGRIGMYGTSYSGFNSLQAACERPAALGAICAIYATDDRYTDDVHYMGGALRAVDLVDYCLYMSAIVTLPPVPSVFGDGWRDEWRRRVEDAEPWLLRWLEEQRDGPYWRHGSVRPAYERIGCPTMLVAGWADGYRNNTFRAFERLTCEKRLLIGPWSHMSTAASLPGPHIDLVPELVRWFGRWLRDEPTGVDEEPPITVFVRRSTRPAPDLAELRGSWRHEPGWPLERSRGVVLRPEPPEGVDEVHVRGDVGVTAWISCAGRLPWGQPDDQRPDDALSTTYEWFCEEELEILGHPVLRLRVTPAAPVQFLSAKLCDVFPDGTSALVTRGFLNLAHRAGSTEPVALTPGAPVEVTIELEATSWVFEAGQRIRLALAGADWPNTWPPPIGGALEVARDGLELELPVLDGPPAVDEAPALPPTTGKDAHAPEEGDEQPVRWLVTRDVLERRTTASVEHGSDYDGDCGSRVTERYAGNVSASGRDPAEATAEATARFRIAWPEAEVESEARLTMSSDVSEYRVRIDVRAEELGGGETGLGRLERTFERVVPRDLQ
jgi:predicted acyl esterase